MNKTTPKIFQKRLYVSPTWRDPFGGHWRMVQGTIGGPLDVFHVDSTGKPQTAVPDNTLMRSVYGPASNPSASNSLMDQIPTLYCLWRRLAIQRGILPAPKTVAEAQKHRREARSTHFAVNKAA